MPISVICIACGSKFTAPVKSAGKRGTCPKCGEPIIVPAFEDELDLVEVPSIVTEPAASDDIPPAITSPTKPSWIIRIGGTFLALCVIFVCVALLIDLAGAIFGDHPDKRDGTMAKIQAEKFVRAKLVSPSSARFSSMRATQSENNFSVSGTVEGQNAFGVLIPHQFDCELQYLGGGEWHCSNVNVYNP